MPWFGRVASFDDLSRWFLVAGPIDGRTCPHLVSRWPSPGSARTDARFRLTTLSPFDAAPSRWFVNVGFDNLTPPPDSFEESGWLDLEAVSIDHLEGNTGENANGINVKLIITGEQNLPVIGGPGVRLVTRTEHAVFGHHESHYEFNKDLDRPWRRQIGTF